MSGTVHRSSTGIYAGLIGACVAIGCGDSGGGDSTPEHSGGATGTIAAAGGMSGAKSTGSGGQGGTRTSLVAGGGGLSAGGANATAGDSALASGSAAVGGSSELAIGGDVGVAGSTSTGGSSTQANGGAVVTLGGASSGGIVASAGSGVVATGGVITTGGSATVATGGVATAGGASATGGITSIATGGVTTTGGASAAGGAITPGGSTSIATGGVATGGITSIATGGIMTGGSTSIATGGVTTGGSTLMAIGGSLASGGSSIAGGAAGTSGTAASGGFGTAGAAGATDPAEYCLNRSGVSTVSGVVNYSGSLKGRVFVSVRYVDSPTVIGGTSVPLDSDGTTAFTIRGLPNQSGNFVLTAFVDALGMGRINVAADPVGETPLQLNGSNVNGVSLTLQEPSLTVPPVPDVDMAIPGDRSVMLALSPSRDSAGKEAATAYRIYYARTSVTTNPGPGDAEGMVEVPLDSVVIGLNGLTNGETYAFAVTGRIGSSESAPSKAVNAIIGSSSVGTTVSGTASYQGATLPSGATFWVAVANPSLGIHITRVSTTTLPYTFTISGVAPGVYRVMAFLDSNDDSVLARLEPHSNFDTAPTLIVGSQPIIGQAVVMSSAAVDARLTTHTWVTNRALNFVVRPNRAMPVRAVVCSGPNLNAPYDLATDEIEETSFSGYVSLPVGTNLKVGDQYPMVVQFADHSTAWTTLTISNVIDALPTAVAPVGEIDDVAPTLSWNLDGTLGAGYQQSVWVGTDSSRNWEYEGIPIDIRSVKYNADGRAQPASLVRGGSYRWDVRVRDDLGNSSSLESVNFTIKP